MKSPGVPGERAARRGGARARDPGLVGGRARLPAAARRARSSASPGTNGKTTTTELLGAIFRAAGRDVAVAGNVGTPLTSVRAGGLGRLRAVVVPARGRARARLRRRGAAQPRAGPPRPARHRSRPTATRSCASSSARARRSCRAGSGLAGIEFSADDALPAEPLIRGAHNRENAAAATAAARAAGIGDERDRRRRCAHSPACRTGSSSSPSATACATSTTRRRRTSPPRAARSPRTPTSRCT